MARRITGLVSVGAAALVALERGGEWMMASRTSPGVSCRGVSRRSADVKVARRSPLVRPQQADFPASATLDLPSIRMATRTDRITLTRPAVADDHEAVNEMHAKCSLESRYARYGAARRSLSHREWATLCDRALGLTLVTVPADNPLRVVALTHLMRTSEPHVRELAVLVEDSWQGEGLGPALVSYVVGLARTVAPGCRVISASTGRSNARMLSILRGLDAAVNYTAGATAEARIRVGDGIRR
ncbi:GNAT family N-acetyltransferase [Streptomyces sp. H23]|uniref:GNAT family N-acetyltransferase n=1 Tax=Streptomyces sp. H23 TaxID=2541723 RepID=UPI0019D1CF25|nr:GNAT family N-acetyltransferase [Streptomyces sp. H23]